MLSESEQTGLLISSLSNLKGEDKHWKGYRFYTVRNPTGKIPDVACGLIGKGIIEVLGKEKDWTTIGSSLILYWFWF